MSNLIVYNASAGSGKTFKLAVEFISLCLKERNPHYFRHILAITFTNKAAHELKERIILFTRSIANGKADQNLIAEILERVDFDETELIARADRLHQAMLYQYADLHVSTIDSFILGILRSFSKELGLPFDFDIELDQEKIKDMLIQSILDGIGHDDFITEQLVTWSTQNLDEDKGWNPKGNMKKALTHLFREESIPFRKKLLDLTEDKLKAELLLLQNRRASLIRNIGDIQKRTQSLLIKNGLEPEDLNGKRKGFISFAFKDFNVHPLPSEKQIDTVDNGNILSADGKKAGKLDAAESIRTELFKAITEVKKSAEQFKDLNRYHKNKMSLILALRLEKLIDHLEKEEGLSILQDNNAKVARLIGENPAPFIYERVGERFKHFLIDEFQDTSLLQWRNMLPLIENSLSVGKKNFLVGDAKQSIYRWRGGEVDQLVELPSVPGSDKDTRLKELEKVIDRNFDSPISLQNNFRSSRSVIEFNNQLFSHLGPGLSEKYRKSYADVAQNITRKTIGFVRSTCLPEKTKLEDCLGLMHEQIRACQEQGYVGSDICILVRTNNEGRIVAKSLEESGYNISSPDALLLSSHADVYLLISLLNVISGSENMRHILYAIDRLLEREKKGAEVVEWYQKIKSLGTANTFKQLMMYLNIHWETDSLQNKDPYSALVSLIDVLEIDSADAYIQELLNQSAGYGNSREATMLGFINYWEDKKDRISVKAGVDRESIQVMTIHKSKGLQFPVVILPHIAWKSNKKGKDKEWVELSGEPLSIGLINLSRELDSTPFAQHLKKEIEKSDLDHLNLLYVALTRAEDRMYLQVSDPGMPGLGRALVNYVTEKGTNDIIEIGSENQKEEQSEEPVTSKRLNDFIRNKREDLLSVALSKEDRTRSKREFGELVHRVIELSERGVVISSALDSILPEEDYSDDDRISVSASVKAAQTLEGLLRIDPANYIKAQEVELLDENGRSFRIDKLYVDQERSTALIIDYKTGEIRESDLKQIERYKEVLQKMGYQDVQGFLLYTESEEIIRA